MKMPWQLCVGLGSAIALQFLGQPLPSEAASLFASFSEEFDGSLLTGTLTGENLHDDGEINAWDLSSFSVSWKEFTWDLTGLGGFRMYYEPDSDIGKIDWIFAQQYQAETEQMQTLGYVPLQQGLQQFSVSDILGIDRIGYQWNWGEGIIATIGDPPATETPIIPPDGNLDPSTSVPEPGILLGLGAIAFWGIKQRQASA